jgi:hypothetical protein
VDENGIDYIASSLTCPGIERITDASRTLTPRSGCAAAILHYQGERGFALMSRRWRAVQHVMLIPKPDRQTRKIHPRPGAIRA